jgi:hypothetical protein
MDFRKSGWENYHVTMISLVVAGKRILTSKTLEGLSPVLEDRQHPWL